MSQVSIPGNMELAEAIKSRRIELNLTIIEAANKAGVGIKTWCRYEAGESIRQDKCKGICKALNWRELPFSNKTEDSVFNVDEYRKNEYWSKELEENFGEDAAISFIIGSEILEDHINEDLADLSHMPKGSHIGELGTSFLVDELPAQFLYRYDYDFLYALRCVLLRLKNRVKYNNSIIAHSVIEELVLYLILEESRFLIEEGDYTPEDNWDEWVFDILGDMDIITFLYSDLYMADNDQYHFDNWNKEVFYTDNNGV